MRPLLSVLLALVLAPLGTVVVALSGTVVVRAALTLSVGPETVVAIAGMVLGLLLIGAAAASVAVHALGAAVLAIPHLVLGALALFPSAGTADLGPALQLASALRRAVGTPVDVLLPTWFAGVTLAIGCVLAGSAVAAWRPARGIPAASRAIVGGVAGVVGLGAVVLVLVAGETLLVLVTRFLVGGPGALLAAALVLVASLLLGAVAASARWTVLGPLVLGALVSLLGLAAVVAPVAVAGAAASLPRPGGSMAGLGQAIGDLGMTGGIAMLGLVMLAGALGVAVRRAFPGRSDAPANG